MAIAANSVSVNVSRAVGPALGGALLGSLGVPAPFLLNAVSNVAVIGALTWWPEPARAASRLPPEHFASAMITGLRHARYNRHLSLGSVVWGEAASRFGVAPALLAAAVGGVLSVPLLRRWRLQTAKGIDLTPAMSWPSPAAASDINPARGPVLVTITYRIDPKDREAFLETIQQAGRERCRDGAYDWGVFEDPGDITSEA